MEQCLVDQAATRVKRPVTTIPSSGTLFDHASEVLGVALAPSLTALGKSIGQHWQKNHKEATVAAPGFDECEREVLDGGFAQSMTARRGAGRTSGATS